MICYDAHSNFFYSITLKPPRRVSTMADLHILSVSPHRIMRNNIFNKHWPTWGSRGDSLMAQMHMQISPNVITHILVMLWSKRSQDARQLLLHQWCLKNTNSALTMVGIKTQKNRKREILLFGTILDPVPVPAWRLHKHRQVWALWSATHTCGCSVWDSWQ